MNVSITPEVASRWHLLIGTHVKVDELRQLVVQVTSRIDQLSLDIADDRERRPDTPSEFGSGEDVPSTYPTLSSPLASNRKKGKSASTPSRSGRKVEFEGAPTSNWSPSRNTGPTASGSHSSIIYSYGGPSIPAAASPRATTSTVRASGRALNLPKAEQERIKAGISNSDRIYVVYKGRGGVGVFKDWYDSTLLSRWLLKDLPVD